MKEALFWIPIKTCEGTYIGRERITQKTAVFFALFLSNAWTLVEKKISESNSNATAQPSYSHVKVTDGKKENNLPQFPSEGVSKQQLKI